MPRSRTALRLAALALLVAGCGAATGPASAPATGGPSDPPASGPTPVPTVPATDDCCVTAPAQEIPGQTDTAWGRIWDELPIGFPTGSAGPLAQVDPDEPASGAFDTQASVADVTAALQAGLEEGRFSTLSLSGPFEDGSMTIESVGPQTTDCQVQTRIAPLGSLTRITVLYGAACPFPLE